MFFNKNVFISYIILLVSCQNTSHSSTDTLIVAVAANVQFAMDALEKSFEQQYPHVDIQKIVSSSGKLTAQIQQGAPYAVFLSADMKYPLFLQDNNLTEASPKVYAKGTLVLWQSTKTISPLQLLSLTSNEIEKIALANPQNAPYGEAAINVLKQLNLYEKVEDKLVYGESIAQTNQYILSGACPLGFTAKSVVLSPILKGKGQWIDIDKQLYQPIEQGIVITNHGQQNHLKNSQLFYDFIFSDTARQIFETYGYEIPKN